MVALGNQTQRFVILKLVQAHGALQRSLPDFKPPDDFVLQGRERVDNAGVEATRGAASGAAGDGPAGAYTAGLRVGAVADVDGEETHEEEGGDQDGDDDRHGGAEALVPIRVVSLLVGSTGLSSDE